MGYIDNISRELKDYFNILEPDYPTWLDEYINTPVLLKQQYISVTCGTIYSDLFESEFFFSSLDHSVAVALIIWHFTHDKKQTLSGLFHDVATPVFKHCIDFLRGDYMNQESTEDITHELIANSSDVMALLERDNIDIKEIDDYHIYPIADNDTPKLSSDRLEYSLSNGLFTYRLADADSIREIYNNIVVDQDSDGVTELSFTDVDIARKFVDLTTKLSIIYREDRTRYSMQFIADIVKRLNADGLITLEDLYNYKESEVIDIILKSKYVDVFNKWRSALKVNISDEEPKDVYYVNTHAKVRYIDPLVNGVRVSSVDSDSKIMIDENLAYNMDKYVYLDFNF